MSRLWAVAAFFMRPRSLFVHEVMRLSPLLIAVAALAFWAGCDLLRNDVTCADICGRVYDYRPCEGAGAVLRQCPLAFEITSEAVRCNGGTVSCIRFRFTTGEAILLDRVVVRTPGGGSATLSTGGSRYDPGEDYPLQADGTAYPFEEGRWFFTFLGEPVPEYVEPRFEIEASVFVRN